MSAIALAREPARRGRLRRRILAWLLLFSLMPLLVTNAVGYRRSADIIQQLIERYLASIAGVQAEYVRARADQQLLRLEAVASGHGFAAAGVSNRPAVERVLQRTLEDLPGIDVLYVFTPEGSVVADVGTRTNLDTTLPAPGPLTSSLTSKLVETPRGAFPQFRLLVPILGSGGRPVAYLAGLVGVRGFRDVLRLPEHLAGRVESFVVDAAGRPLFVSHPSDSLNYAAQLTTPLLALSAESSDEYRSQGGGRVLGAITPVPGYPWRFVAEVPTDEAFAALRRLGGLSVLLQLWLVALLVATGWVVSREIVAPLNRLVHATRQVGRGDLSVRVSDKERDELGELGHAFNEMTSALAETTARVQTLHRREIERASQLATVGELASGIAHEIKNPVVGVSNGLDLLRRRAGQDVTLLPIIDEMERQMSRIQQAIQELLTFARPATPTLAPVSGNDLVDRAIRLMQPSADRGGVRVEVFADPGLPRFLADEDMLHQALVNLLMNAIEATPRGGRIDVHTRASGPWIQIEIVDTGRGIAAADLEAVFKPFFTTRHTGTGLGLPISREIVQRHGGTVTLESREGKGTVVTVRLPAHAGESADGAEALPA